MLKNIFKWNLIISTAILFFVPCYKAAITLDLNDLKKRVKDMFYHAYNGYIEYAYPYDELRPLTCDGHDTWGSVSLTLVDSLSTLAVLGNHSEFRRAAALILKNLDPNKNVNVSVFETNIRVVGGLLSAHLLARRTGMHTEPGWPCHGKLLSLAERFANKLLPAFNTPTGLPYGTVNLKLGGVPLNETPITCVATAGTAILEFGALSRLTGDVRYEEAALRAIRSLWMHRSKIGLVGNHINVLTAQWVGREATIGGGVDSYFEYLLKGAVMFRMPELDAMFREYREAIRSHLKMGAWHFITTLDEGRVTNAVSQSLEAFWPGTLAMAGEISEAKHLLIAYHSIWRKYGFLPETFDVLNAVPLTQRSSYPLRPEFIESIMYLYRATKDPYLLQMGVNVLTSIEQQAKTPCGFATIRDVRTHHRENRMESFFLSETIKYLYLLFDEDNFIHQVLPPPPFDAKVRDCLYEGGSGYVFNTEAHPLDSGLIHCCSLQYARELEAVVDAKKTTRHRRGRPIAMSSILEQVDEVFQQLHSSEGHGKRSTELDRWLDDLWTSMREIITHPSEIDLSTATPINYTLPRLLRTGASSVMTCHTMSFVDRLQTMQDMDFRNLY